MFYYLTLIKLCLKKALNLIVLWVFFNESMLKIQKVSMLILYVKYAKYARYATLDTWYLYCHTRQDVTKSLLYGQFTDRINLGFQFIFKKFTILSSDLGTRTYKEAFFFEHMTLDLKKSYSPLHLLSHKLCHLTLKVRKYFDWLNLILTTYVMFIFRFQFMINGYHESSEWRTRVNQNTFNITVTGKYVSLEKCDFKKYFKVLVMCLHLPFWKKF